MWRILSYSLNEQKSDDQFRQWSEDPPLAPFRQVLYAGDQVDVYNMQDVFDPTNNSGKRATIVSINRDGALRFDPSFTMFNDNGYNDIRRVATRHGIANGEYEDVIDGVFVHHRMYLFHVGSISPESISRHRLSFGGLVAHINERTLPGLDGKSLPNHADLAVGKPATVDDNVSGDGAPGDGSVIGGDGAVDDNVSGDGAPGDGSIIGDDGDIAQVKLAVTSLALG